MGTHDDEVAAAKAAEAKAPDKPKRAPRKRDAASGSGRRQRMSQPEREADKLVRQATRAADLFAVAVRTGADPRVITGLRFEAEDALREAEANYFLNGTAANHPMRVRASKARASFSAASAAARSALAAPIKKSVPTLWVSADLGSNVPPDRLGDFITALGWFMEGCLLLHGFKPESATPRVISARMASPLDLGLEVPSDDSADNWYVDHPAPTTGEVRDVFTTGTRLVDSLMQAGPKRQRLKLENEVIREGLEREALRNEVAKAQVAAHVAKATRTEELQQLEHGDAKDAHALRRLQFVRDNAMSLGDEELVKKAEKRIKDLLYAMLGERPGDDAVVLVATALGEMKRCAPGGVDMQSIEA
ncbi:hypothetical protein [Yimella sp. cx-51]|uniref:hypothetical protein n=1 Tax=Yimella sp. cx-51 TaxID=2770551 RepID=UPI00165EABB1|nr:hypothetical protein [Yimella sp. cx-51]MBC9958372.1 hypothetical protein [Yimella sp. cx-51]QTH39754.1 hypothetical protein J5M86_15180 [Yimella sp. cx-51]